MKNFFKEHGIKLLINTLGAFLVVIIYLALSTSENAFTSLINYVNGFFIAGFMYICFAGLSFVTNHGAFDMFTYSFRYVFTKGKKETLGEYTDNKNIVRSKKKHFYMPYLIIGIVFILISLAMYPFIFK